MTTLWGIPVERAAQVLEHVAGRLSADGVCFDVHYWGLDHCHRDNLLHAHSFFEVCYVVHGEGMYIDGEERFAIQTGTLFLSRPGTVHQIRSYDGLELLFVAFTTHCKVEVDAGRVWKENFDRLAGDGFVVVQDQAEDSPVALLWKALIVSCANDPRWPVEFIESIGSSLLTSFPATFLPLSGRERQHPLRTAHPVTQRAMQFVRDNLGSPLALATVAQYLHVSPRHLFRLMRDTCGVGYTAFVQQERLARARQLLSETAMPIKDVASMTGFSSVHYFTRLFTRESGVTPGTYRHQHGALLTVR